MHPLLRILNMQNTYAVLEGCKAISSHKDYEMYEAIRLLSIVKEAEDTPQATIDAAEKSSRGFTKQHGRII
jgi:phenylalanine-4-hydroxylase